MTRLILAGLALAASGAVAQTSEGSLVELVRSSLSDNIVTQDQRKLAEHSAALLDTLNASSKSRIEAHAWLAWYYRKIGYDDGIIWHAKTAIALLDTLNDADRAHLAQVSTDVYRNLAVVLASRGKTDTALDLLQHARIPGHRDDLIALYQMVGQPAPAIEADYWLNMYPGPAGLEIGGLAGQATIVAFNAWWCATCYHSLPTLYTLQKEYGPNRLRVILATSLAGRFPGHSHVAPQEELKLLENVYTDRERLTGPIAVLDNPGDGEDANMQRYHVTAYPAMVVIDWRGRIVRVLSGWSANEYDYLKQALRVALGARP